MTPLKFNQKKGKPKRKKRAKTIHCSICGRACPSNYKTFDRRMAWLRRHRKRTHPTAHKKSVKKTVRTRTKPEKTTRKISKQFREGYPI
jgi:ferredoxin